MHRRTQKTSKHKKIKACDPCYTGPRKNHVFKADKNANKPPTGTAGAQEIPRKLQEMMKAKEAIRNEKVGGETSRSRNKYAGLQKDKDVVPEFKRGKYETQLHFYRRMDKAAQESITKAELEVQFDVNFERQGKNKLVVSTRKDPLALHKPPKSVTDPEVTLSKSQKRKGKLQQKREQRKAYNRDEFAEMRDTVEFGEVVLAPPQIKAMPRKAPKVKAAGEKKLLLLSKLHPEIEEEAPPEKRSLFDAISDVSADTIAAARQELKRKDAVDAYRQLKKKRTSQ